MRLHRFFVSEKINLGAEVVLSDDTLLSQWVRVFRFRNGDQVILLDNSGKEFVAQIVHIGKQEVKLVIVEHRENNYKPKKEVLLFMSMIKKGNFEWVLEKGTEIGVTHFIPVIASRSEKKNINIERGEIILKEAAEQSGKVFLPTLHQPVNFNEAVEMCNTAAIVFEPSGKKYESQDFDHDQVSIFIGPEGGWSDQELVTFKEKKFSILSIGDTVLRAETAALATASLLLL